MEVFLLTLCSNIFRRLIQLKNKYSVNYASYVIYPFISLGGGQGGIGSTLWNVAMIGILCMTDVWTDDLESA